MEVEDVKKKETDQYIEQVCLMIEEKLKEYDLKGFVTGRPKHFYSIYKKMDSRGVEYDQIHDIIASQRVWTPDSGNILRIRSHPCIKIEALNLNLKCTTWRRAVKASIANQF